MIFSRKMEQNLFRRGYFNQVKTIGWNQSAQNLPTLLLSEYQLRQFFENVIEWGSFLRN